MQEIGGRYRQYRKDTNLFLNWLFTEAAQPAKAVANPVVDEQPSELAINKSAKARKKARQKQTKREQADSGAASLLSRSDSSDGEVGETKVSVQEIRDAAQHVSEKARYLPPHIAAVLRRTIDARKGFSRYFKSPSETDAVPLGDGSHAYFVELLQECLELLQQPQQPQQQDKPALKSSSVDEGYRSDHRWPCMLLWLISFQIILWRIGA